MDKYNKLGKNIILVFLGSAGSKLINIIMLPLYTRWLPPEQFGTSDIVITYASLLLSVVSCCIYDAIFVVPRNNATEEEKCSFFTTGWLFTIIVIGIVGAIFYGLSKINSWGGNVFCDYSLYIYLILVATFLQAYTQSFTKSIDKMNVYCITGVVNTAFVALLAFVFIPAMGLKGYLLSIILAYLISSVYSFVASKSYIYVRWSKCRKDSLLRLLKYGIPLIPNSLMFWLVNGLNRPIIEKYVGLEANGILAVANKIPGVISSLFIIFSNAWVISVMEEYGKPDFSHFFNKSIRCVTLISFIFASLLCMFSREVIMILADEAYIEAYKFVPIAIIGSILSGIGGNVGSIFAAREKSKYFFYSSFWGALFSVIFMFLLIPTFQLYGAVIASTLSFLAITVTRFIYARKDLKDFDYKSIIGMIVGLIIISILVPLNVAEWVKWAAYICILLAVLVLNKDILNDIQERLKRMLKISHN